MAKKQNRKAKKETRMSFHRLGDGAKATFRRLKKRTDDFLRRRPHRSFRRTRRRDYARSLKLPGYWAFTAEVAAFLWRYKKTFLLLAFVYALVTATFVGIVSQSSYEQINETLKETGGQMFAGQWWEIGKAGLILGTGIMGSLSNTPNDLERGVAVIVGLLVWLTTIWLLRALMAGKKPRLRDGLYGAGAPIVATFFLFIVLLIQLLPLALAALALSAASTTGLIDGGIEAMVFWSVEILLLLVSLYWLASTFFALVIVTLPGMYPMRALASAGDLVIGRRLRIFLRFLWLFVLTFITWALIIIPIILIDGWLKPIWPAIAGVPIVPVSLLVVASLSLVWASSYTYMLYRKVVDDGAAPA